MAIRPEIKMFLQSSDLVLRLPRDRSTDVISQWMTCRNVCRAPLNFLLCNIAKVIPLSRWTSAFYRTFLGMSIGKNVGFAPCDPDYLLPEAISIGDGSAIGWRTQLLTHEFTQDTQRYGKIQIGGNVTIGAFTTIRGGVRIGDNSLVAMRSFVNKDIPANEIWGGVPARKMRSLTTETAASTRSIGVMRFSTRKNSVERERTLRLPTGSGHIRSSF